MQPNDVGCCDGSVSFSIGSATGFELDGGVHTRDEIANCVHGLTGSPRTGIAMRALHILLVWDTMSLTIRVRLELLFPNCLDVGKQKPNFREVMSRCRSPE
jgi:hypothetical protein